MSQCTLNVSEKRSVVVKEATGADVAHLRSEGERLRLATHPGVVEVLSSTGTDDRWRLEVAHGGRPLDTVADLTPNRLALLVAATAETLADLHDAGVVHGHITSANVLVSGHDRVRLCGLGDAESIAGRDPADDVAALGRMIVEVLNEPTMRSRSRGRRFGAARADGHRVERRLRVVASHCLAEPASRRPSCRQLATRLVPPRRGEATSRPAHLRKRRGSPRAAAALGLSGAVAAAIGTLTAIGTPEAVSGTTDVSANEPIDAEVRVDGRVVTYRGEEFEVGEPGDFVAAGDWDCDGRPGVAVVRPGTGEVFLFNSWADADAVVVTATTIVNGATAFAPRPGCGLPALTRADGSRITLDKGRP